MLGRVLLVLWLWWGFWGFSFGFERVLIAIYCNSIPILWVQEPHFFQRQSEVRDCEMVTDKPDKILGQASAESGKGESPTGSRQWVTTGSKRRSISCFHWYCNLLSWSSVLYFWPSVLPRLAYVCCARRPVSFQGNDLARLEETSRDVSLCKASYIFLPLQAQNRRVAHRGCNHRDLVAALYFFIKKLFQEEWNLQRGKGQSWKTSCIILRLNLEGLNLIQHRVGWYYILYAQSPCWGNPYLCGFQMQLEKSH